MKKLTVLGLSVALVVGLGALSLAQNPQTRNAPNGNTSIFDYCPWHNTNANSMMRHNMMGRAMMGGQMNGRMMVDDCDIMMGSGQMNSSMHRNNSNAIYCPRDAAEFNAWRQSNKISTPLSKDSVRQWAEYYVNAYNNPDLTLGKITEKNNGFEIEVRSKQSKKVLEKILVDEQTGWISQVQN